MPRTFHLEIITPSCIVYENEISSLSVPTRDGRLGIMAGHQPMVSPLKEGLVKIRPQLEGQPLELPIKGGYLEVDHEKVVIMIDLDNEEADDRTDLAERSKTEAVPSEPKPSALSRIIETVRHGVRLEPKRA